MESTMFGTECFHGSCLMTRGWCVWMARSCHCAKWCTKWQPKKVWWTSKSWTMFTLQKWGMYSGDVSAVFLFMNLALITYHPFSALFLLVGHPCVCPSLLSSFSGHRWRGSIACTAQVWFEVGQRWKNALLPPKSCRCPAGHAECEAPDFRTGLPGELSEHGGKQTGIIDLGSSSTDSTVVVRKTAQDWTFTVDYESIILNRSSICGLNPSDMLRYSVRHLCHRRSYRWSQNIGWHVAWSWLQRLGTRWVHAPESFWFWFCDVRHSVEHRSWMG